MKKTISLIFAIMALCACNLGNEEINEVTAASLEEYAVSKLGNAVIIPAYELGACLFTSEYMAAGEAGRNALLSKYKLSGKFHQIDPKTFSIDGFGEIATDGRAFDDSFWGKKWKKAGEQWVSPEGIHFMAVRDSDGTITDFIASGGPLEDSSWPFKASLSFPDGEFRFTNPLFKERLDLLYCFDYYRYYKPDGITFTGSFRADIKNNGQDLDWVVLSADNQDKFRCTSSRD